MSRLRNIDEKISDNKRHLKNIKYPNIPLSIDDIHIITIDGDRLDLIANRFYKDSDLWWVISIANPSKIRRDSFFIKPGTQIRIPIDLDSIMEDFEKVNKPLI